MKNYLILFYSNTGNCQFLAEKLSGSLEADVKKITPSFKGVLLLYLLSLLKIRVPINLTQKDFAAYDEIILLGPIWGGLLISPLQSALKIWAKTGKPLHFAVSCETSDEDREKQYGYVQVLKKVEGIGGELVKTSTAFTTALIRTNDTSWGGNLTEKVKITEENFKYLKGRFEDFVDQVQEG